jgi:hypothetical protein
MYENFTDHDLLETPAAVVAEARHLVDVYQARHDGFFPPTHRLAGDNSERASVGLPGHCWVCAVVGHPVAHPEYGCGDVRCNVDH